MLRGVLRGTNQYEVANMYSSIKSLKIHRSLHSYTITTSLNYYECTVLYYNYSVLYYKLIAEGEGRYVLAQVWTVFGWHIQQ